ncbi:hypothetical protein [Streptomyces sp. NPDC093260]|uniref:hypothetical protein n=1 Tax=Streptomyces sp. NPDC093260 TaxID=3155073 RepID=UPI0034355669
MGSLRLTVCAGLLVAGAFAPALDTNGAAGPADRLEDTGHSRVATTTSAPTDDKSVGGRSRTGSGTGDAVGRSPGADDPSTGDPSADGSAAGDSGVVPAPATPTPPASASASASAQAVPKTPGTAHAVTGLVLAAAAAVAVVLLPRALGRDRARRTHRGTD